MISTKLPAESCSEGTASIPVHLGARARLLDRLRQQVHRAADQFCQASFQCTEREQPDAGFRVELDKKIDVAFGFSIATGNGTKQRQVTDASMAQFHLMLPKGW